MNEIYGFPPVATRESRILILGSMPGIRSLEENQYYAHKQNSFWIIIEALFGINSALEYEQRIRLVSEHGIAVWDVLKECIREGSLDSSIEAGSVHANDFELFLQQHKKIKCIFFNGARAEQEYKKHVLPILPERFNAINYYRLPSTSPAHASITRQEKIEQWKIIKQCLYHKQSESDVC
ncbi:MAG: DNA-deoxyinosine glycosylase [Gammaproteobacteria bacterium]|nr:DNA-deoxyinosine glycosylase [Gammaproteobacteria bacterium]